MNQKPRPSVPERPGSSIRRPQVPSLGSGKARTAAADAPMQPSSANGSSTTLPRLLSAFIVVAVGRISDLVPGLSFVPLAKIVVILAVIAAARLREPRAPITWKSVPPAKLTFYLMSAVTLSILFSVLRSATFAIITASALAVVIILLLTIKVARSWPPIKTILSGTVIASMILVATVFRSKLGGRAGYSSSYDPNDFAYVLIGFLPLVITFGIISKGSKRLMYIGTAGGMIVAILLTQSRGGLIGLMFEIVAMTFALPVAWRGGLQFQTSKSRVLARVALLALVGFVIWHSLPGDARDRLASVTALGSDYNADATASGPYAGRLAIWSRNLPLVAARPWGYGAGAFETVDGRYAGGRYRAPHNTFLQALVELGVHGFALFIAIIFSTLRYLKMPGRTREQQVNPFVDEQRAFARALGIGVVGLCIAGFFLSELYANVFWTLVTLSCAVGIVNRIPCETPGNSSSIRPVTR